VPVAKKTSKNFPLCPEGPQQLVCCDIVDLGLVENKKFNKKQHKVRLVFQSSDVDPENSKPFQVSEQFTLSLDEKANLRKFIESWLGKKLTDQQVEDGIDLDKLLGVNGQGNIIHNKSAANGKNYANIGAIMPLAKGVERLQVTKDYVRAKDRVKDAPGSAGTSESQDESDPF
jgi:hypothetical protein